MFHPCFLPFVLYLFFTRLHLLYVSMSPKYEKRTISTIILDPSVLQAKLL